MARVAAERGQSPVIVLSVVTLPFLLANAMAVAIGLPSGALVTEGLRRPDRAPRPRRRPRWA